MPDTDGPGSDTDAPDPDTDAPIDDTDAPAHTDPPGNQPPALVVASITPAQPRSNQALQLSFVVPEDPDGDPVTVSYAWSVSPQPAHNLASLGAIVPASFTTRGEVWTATLTASDGQLTSAPSTVSVTIGNTPGTWSSAVVSPSQADRTQQRVCTPVGWSDADGDPAGARYAWRIDNAEVAGVTAPVLPVNHLYRGASVRCVVTPDDGFDLGPPVTSAANIVANAVPSLTAASLSSAAPFLGDVLDLVDVQLSDADPEDTLTLDVSWRVGLTEVASGVPWTVDRPKGTAMSARIRAFDGLAYSAPLVRNFTVQNAPPVVGPITVVPDSPRTGQAIQAFAGVTDADGDATTLRWIYRRDDQVVQDGPVRTLPSGSPRGAVIQVTAIATDGEAESEPQVSAPITIANTPPTVASVRIEPDAPTSSDVLTVEAVGVADADGDPVTLDVAWWAGGEVVGTEPELPTGTLSRGDVVYAVVTPRDDADAGVAATTPSVEIANSLPRVVSARVQPEPLRPGSVASVVDIVAEDADGDEITVGVRWLASDGTGASAPSFAVPQQADALVTVEVFASDDEGEGPAWVLELPVVNAAPVVVDAWLLPEAPTVLDAIRGEAVATDADGDEVSLRWTFLVDGAVAQVDEGDELLVPVVRGQVISATVTPFDGFVAGAPLEVDPAEVSNAAPQVVSAELSSVRPEVGDVVEVIDVLLEDPDAGDVPTVEVSWWAGGQMIATGPAWTASGAVGTEMLARLIPTDGIDTGSPYELPFVIASSPPLVSGVVIAPPGARVDELLTASAIATSASGETLSLRFTWEVDGEVVQDGPEATLAAPPGGSVVVVSVVAIDSFGEGPSSMSAPYIVTNTPPTLGSAQVIPDPPRRRDTLAAELAGAFDADGHPLTFIHEWRATSVPGASGAVVGNEATLPDRVVSRGQEVWVRVRPNDGYDDGAVVVSARRTVANSPPEVVAAALSNLSPRKGDTIEVRDVLVDDADGDPTSLGVTWWVDGAEVASGMAFVNTGTRGAQVEARVVASDATEAGEALVLHAEVVNSAPGLGGLVLSPIPPRRGDVLHISGVPFDADGDAVEVTWTFLVNDVAVQTGTDDSYDGPLFRGDRVVVVGVPHDGIVAGAAVATEEVEVVNTPPTLDSLQILPVDPRVGDDLVAVVGAVADVDGDTVTVSLEWVVGGGVVGTDDVLDAGSAFRGQTVRLRATLDDGYGGVSLYESTTVIRNTPPTAMVQIEPVEPLSADTLHAVWSGADDDGDEVFGAIQWFINGDPVDGATTSILLSSATRRFDEVQVRLVANDGYGGVITVWSEPVEVRVPDPSPPVAVIRPNEPQAGLTPLKCVIFEPVADAEGTPYGQSFVWVEDGVPRTDIIGDTVPANQLTAGSRWTCVPTVTDYGTPYVGTSYEVEVGEAGRSAIAVSEEHACALRSDHRASCFGRNQFGQSSPPNAMLTRVAVSQRGSCGIQASGALHCWGATSGNLPTTAGFIDLTGAGQHFCGLRADNSVACWGQGSGGEQSAPFPVVAYHAISAGITHNCGVRTDGRAGCWGRNDFGQRDAPDGVFRQVAAGYHQSCGVRVDGELVCWGWNNSGVPEGLTGYRSVAMARFATCAIRFGGEIDCWAAESDLTLTPPPGLEALTVHLAEEGGCAVTMGGEFVCWGDDDFGQRTLPDRPLSEISMGDEYVCGIADPTGELVCWGPRPMGELEPEGSFISVSVGLDHACAVRAEDGAVVCWGETDRGQGDVPAAGPFIRVDTLVDLTCALGADGRPVCWGPPELLAPAPSGNFTHIAVSEYHACGRTSSNELRCWSGVVATEPDTDIDTDGFDTDGFDTDALHTDPPPTDPDPAALIPPSYISPPPQPFSSPQQGYCGNVIADLVAGRAATCALLTCGDTVCWGDEDAIQDRRASFGFSSVSHPPDHLCGLNSDGFLRNHRGEARCIGPDSFELRPPFDLPLRAIDLGVFGGCVTERASWLPRCWGDSARQPLF